MAITFPRTENRSTMPDPISFIAAEGRRRIVCKVGHSTLQDAEPNHDNEPITELWKRCIDVVEKAATLKIGRAEFEPDSTIIVRRKDIEEVRRGS